MGVQLLDKAILAGVEVFPTVHKNGYQIKIRNKGIQHLSLKFSVPVTTAGDAYDLRFSAPKLLANDMAIQWPTVVQSVHALDCWGEEKTNAGPLQLVKGWRAQLGYTGTVHLRWSSATPTALAKAIEVKELHFWDLRPASLSLMTSLHYSLGKGSLSQISVALPESLHVRSVEVLQASTPTAPATAVAIKHSQTVGKGSQRRLTIDFTQPVTQSLLVNLEIVPHFAVHTKSWVLPLPMPLQGRSVLGHVGYRIDAPLEGSGANLSVSGISPAAFADVWKHQSQQPIEPASGAWRFQRTTVQEAKLGLVMKPTDRLARVDVVWKPGMHHADWSVSCTLSSTHEEMVMQTFVVPKNLTLSNVQGAEVARWNLRENLLQVWFRKPCKTADLEITGWQRFDNPSLESTKRTFALSSIYPLAVKAVKPGGSTMTLKVQPFAGITVDPVPGSLKRLRPVGLQQYAMEDITCEGTFRLQETTALPAAQALMRIQPTEQGTQ